MDEIIKKRLLELAKRSTVEERGNFNRGEYEDGTEDGFTLLAREILDTILSLIHI